MHTVGRADGDGADVREHGGNVDPLGSERGEAHNGGIIAGDFGVGVGKCFIFAKGEGG